MAHDQVDKLMCVCGNAGNVRNAGQIVSHPAHFDDEITSCRPFKSLAHHQVAEGGKHQQQSRAHQPNFKSQLYGQAEWPHARSSKMYPTPRSV
ncbi:hypothetical protein D3C77_331440 [compost metagenome]